MTDPNICRRCDTADYRYGLTEGLCRKCQIEAGLVACSGCGRLLPREVATVDQQTVRDTYYLCPPCAHQQAREIATRHGIAAGTHRVDGSAVEAAG